MLISYRKKRVLMFVDISGSSSLYRQLGDAKAKQLIDEEFKLLAELRKKQHGKLIKTIGDELMVTFKSVNNAVSFAIQAQQLSNGKNKALTLRIGIDFGEVILDKGDVFGEVVNNAAHLTGLASGGQIIVSESIADNLPTQYQHQLRAYDQIALKGQQFATVVYRLFWQQDNEQHTETRFFTGSILKEMNFQLVLSVQFGQTNLQLAHDDPAMTIGRDKGRNQLCVDFSRVSRCHCLIEYRNGKFVVEDFSTNGCWIQGEDGSANFIRREEFPLLGNGRLALGMPFSESAVPVIHFYQMD